MLQLTSKFTPSFKDEECFEQNAYGCKDEYGVSYPIWYHNSLAVEAVNTDAPQKIKAFVEPYLSNVAESVYMSKNFSSIGDELKVEFIVRPQDNKVGVLKLRFCCKIPVGQQHIDWMIGY